MNQDLLIFLFTKILSTETLLVIISILLLDLIRCKKYRESLWLIFSTAVTAVLVITLKEYFAVARPDDALVLLDTYAFPSGHSTFAVFFAIVFWWYSRSVLFLSKKWLGVGLTALIFLVGYSRLFLQVHTAEQVLVGFILGAATGLAFIWGVKKKFGYIIK
jgi:undecaprenyl-diphosphatase